MVWPWMEAFVYCVKRASVHTVGYVIRPYLHVLLYIMLKKFD